MAETREDVEKKEDAPCCPVCLERYSTGSRIAKLLPTCLHTLCSECCGKLNPTKCPLDRVDFNMPQEGAEGLATNYALMAAVEAAIDATGEGQADESNLCTLCEERTSTTRCIDCQGDPCCDVCWKMRKKQRFAKNHQSGPLDTAVLPKAMCRIHPQHELKYFCVDDEEMFCMACFPTSVHRTHNSVEADKAIDAVNADSIQEEANLKQQKLQEILQKNVQAREDIKAQYKDLSRSISVYYQQVMAAVKAQEEKVQANLSALRDTKNKRLEAQHDQLSVQAHGISTLSNQVSHMKQVGSPVHVVQFTLQMKPLLAQQEPGDGPTDGPSLCFSMDDKLIDTVKASGSVSDDAPDAKLCAVEGVENAGCVGEENTFTIYAVTARGTRKTAGGDTFNIRARYQKEGEPMGDIIPHRIEDVGDGSYVVYFTVPEELTTGSIQLDVGFQGIPLTGFPLEITLQQLPEGTELRSPAMWAAVKKMLPPQCKKSLKLLHNRHGNNMDESGEYHAAVDGHKQILTIIKAKETDFVFGGFFMEQCGSTNGWIAGDKQNFLFSLGEDAAGSHVKLLNSDPPPNQYGLSSQKCGFHMGNATFAAFCTRTSWSTRSTSRYFKVVAPGYQPLASPTISGVVGGFTPVVAEVYECL